jgi:hypothetical protein
MRLMYLLSLSGFLSLISCSTPPKYCGMDPSVARELSTMGPLNTSDAECRICLRRMWIDQGQTHLRITKRNPDRANPADYISKDGGNTWTRAGSDWDDETNITTTQTQDLSAIMSRVDWRIVYSNTDVGKGVKFRRSFDGGDTFSVVVPIFTGDSPAIPDDFDIISTSMIEPRRVYARAYIGKDKAVFASNDYGDHFVPISERASFIKESDSDPNRLYAFGDNGLTRSRDGGRKWEALTGSADLFSPVFEVPKSRLLRTKRLEGASETAAFMNAEWYAQSWLFQIETDPQNANVVYVVCAKGLYRSNDGGDSFRLLPLAADQFRGIAKIGIDPLNGKNIFAVVGTSLLYRSADSGCTWVQVTPPKQ